MIDPKIIDDISRKIADAIPPGVSQIKTELEHNIHSIVESYLSKLNLVSRDEFDIQTAVLARTREKLEALESELAKLEDKYLNPPKK